ncbi:MAG: hypothetical protein R3A51_23830, partial [Nannocystaceae bacterium]
MLSLRFGRGPACLLLLAALGCRTGADAPPASCPEPQVIVAPAVDPEPVAAQGEAPAVDAAPELVEAAARLADAVAREPVRDRAWRRLAALVDRFGHRLSGSEALERTIDWCLDEMRADGLTAVRREEVWVPHWVRGEESARLVRPVARPLKLLGLGGTVGTGRRPLRGEVAVVGSLDELTARGEALRDKIVLINQVMPAYDEAQRETFYGHT